MATLRSRSLTLAMMAGLLVGACGSEQVLSPTAVPSPTEAPASSAPPASPAPTPAPTLTATPSASPTATPSAQPTPGTAKAQTFTGEGEIRDVLFAPDGRMVVVESDSAKERSRIVTLDALGHVLPGWPWSAGDTGSPIGGAALGPDRSVYVAVRAAQGAPATFNWRLHRLDSNGIELPGFPVELPGVSFCGISVSGEIAYALCQEDDEATGTFTTSVRAVRPDGSTTPGWPVDLDGAGEIAGFRPDGAVVVTLRQRARTDITVLREDGTPAAGWPRTAPKGTQSATVDRQGRVHVTARVGTEERCGPTPRTTYTVFKQDGSPVAGWPVTVRGWASDPLVADDGTSTITSAAAGSVVRYGRKGNVLAGWPVRGVPMAAACWDGSSPVSAGRDGFVVSGEGLVTLVEAAGRIPRGWPVRPPYRPAGDCLGCAPGPGGPLDPAIGHKGIWVAAYGEEMPRVVGIARDGSIPKAWQHAVGKKGDSIEWIRTTPSGRVWMLLTRSVMTGADERVEIGSLVPVAEDLPVAR